MTATRRWVLSERPSGVVSREQARLFTGENLGKQLIKVADPA